MGHPVSGALRAARGLALALVVVGIASTAHLAGGGDLPPGLLLAGVVVAAAFAAHAATARRVTLPAALALLGAGQVVLHVAFTVLAAPAGAGAGALRAAQSASPAGALHVHAHGGPLSGLLLPVDAAAGAASAAGTAGTAGAADPSAGAAAAAMLAAHVVATLAAAVVLAGADRSLWLLLAWLAPLAAVLAASASAVVPRLPRRPVAAPRARPRSLLLARRSLRRGPPLLLLAPA
ncbi:hypothetical protein [Quadrisphaera sp. INWT6]|uniref:hypothetical protein n=1 Tax=Quadrisphaera sp. INWT6 TaxID=2596917 RepID=UPI001892682E|nr:hypothetical protein [Quadrisphaera sp. INWT6]MBF5081271.1 hypothetical protein [Quadrisphaera sp. INWT6]